MLTTRNKREYLDSNNVNSVISSVCGRCGLVGNMMTCFRKYGSAPKKSAFSVSTMWQGTCDFCGEETTVTSVRDFFYPDFNDALSYAKKVTRRNKGYKSR